MMGAKRKLHFLGKLANFWSGVLCFSNRSGWRRWRAIRQFYEACDLFDFPLRSLVKVRPASFSFLIWLALIESSSLSVPASASLKSTGRFLTSLVVTVGLSLWRVLFATIGGRGLLGWRRTAVMGFLVKTRYTSRYNYRSWAQYLWRRKQRRWRLFLARRREGFFRNRYKIFRELRYRLAFGFSSRCQGLVRRLNIKSGSGPLFLKHFFFWRGAIRSPHQELVSLVWYQLWQSRTWTSFRYRRRLVSSIPRIRRNFGRFRSHRTNRLFIQRSSRSLVMAVGLRRRAVTRRVRGYRYRKAEILRMSSRFAHRAVSRLVLRSRVRLSRAIRERQFRLSFNQKADRLLFRYSRMGAVLRSYSRRLRRAQQFGRRRRRRRFLLKREAFFSRASRFFKPVRRLRFRLLTSVWVPPYRIRAYRRRCEARLRRPFYFRGLEPRRPRKSLRRRLFGLTLGPRVFRGRARSWDVFRLRKRRRRYRRLCRVAYRIFLRRAGRRLLRAGYRGIWRLRKDLRRRRRRVRWLRLTPRQRNRVRERFRVRRQVRRRIWRRTWRRRRARQRRIWYRRRRFYRHNALQRGRDRRKRKARRLVAKTYTRSLSGQRRWASSFVSIMRWTAAFQQDLVGLLTPTRCFSRLVKFQFSLRARYLQSVGKKRSERSVRRPVGFLIRKSLGFFQGGTRTWQRTLFGAPVDGKRARYSKERDFFMPRSLLLRSPTTAAPRAAAFLLRHGARFRSRVRRVFCLRFFNKLRFYYSRRRALRKRRRLRGGSRAFNSKPRYSMEVRKRRRWRRRLRVSRRRRRRLYKRNFRIGPARLVYAIRKLSFLRIRRRVALTRALKTRRYTARGLLLLGRVSSGLRRTARVLFSSSKMRFGWRAGFLRARLNWRIRRFRRRQRLWLRRRQRLWLRVRRRRPSLRVRRRRRVRVNWRCGYQLKRRFSQVLKRFEVRRWRGDPARQYRRWSDRVASRIIKQRLFFCIRLGRMRQSTGNLRIMRRRTLSFFSERLRFSLFANIRLRRRLRFSVLVRTRFRRKFFFSLQAFLAPYISSEAEGTGFRRLTEVRSLRRLQLFVRSSLLRRYRVLSLLRKPLMRVVEPRGVFTVRRSADRAVGRYFLPRGEQGLRLHFALTRRYPSVVDFEVFNYFSRAEFFYKKFIQKGLRNRSGIIVLSVLRYLKPYSRFHLIRFIEQFLVEGFPLYFEMSSLKQSNREQAFPVPVNLRYFRFFMLKKLVTRFRAHRHKVSAQAALLTELWSWQIDPTLSLLHEFLLHQYALGLDSRFFVHYRWRVKR